MKVIAFKCSKCGVAFGYAEGGRCEKCNKLFCNNHLYKEKGKKENVLLCDDCLGKEGGRKMGSDLLKIREHLTKLQAKNARENDIDKKKME